MSARVCELPGCSKVLGPSYRKHARFCCSKHRAEAGRKRTPFTPEPVAGRDIPRKRTEAAERHTYASEGTQTPFLVPRMTQEEAERRRPDWHGWVYGGQRNPIHTRKVKR